MFSGTTCHSATAVAIARRCYRLPRITADLLLGLAWLASAANVGRAQDVRLASATVRGDTLRLTLEAARALAMKQNPELAAARFDIDVARGNLRQARTIPTNPTVDVLAPATGTPAEFAIAQEFEIGGQRGLRREVAELGVRAAALSTAETARLMIAEVDRAFYRLFAAAQRADLSAEVLTLNGRLHDAARRQMAEGEISKLDLNLTVIELGRSRAQSIAALRERNAADLELRRLLALGPASSVEPMLDSAHRHIVLDTSASGVRNALTFRGVSLAELTTEAYTKRPDMRAREAAIRRATADATLAQREAIPNLAARITTEGNNNGSGSVVRPGIGVSLPLLNRNRGTVEARRAAVQQAQAERAVTGRKIRTEIESALRAYYAAAAEVEVLESTVLVPARENRQLLEAAYREGKVGLPVLLLIRNQVIDAEKEYWSAWLNEREALANLSAATGENTSTTSGDQR